MADFLTTIAALASASDDLCAAALQTLRPDQAGRLAAGARPFVVFGLHPFQAGVFVECDDAEPILLSQHDGPHLRPIVDAPLAAFVERELARLPAANQQDVATALRCGGRLAVSVTPWPFALELILFVAGEPYVIGRVTGAPETTH